VTDAVATPGRARGALELVLYVLAFVIAGLVTLALLWSGPAPYTGLARDNGVTRYVFLVKGPGGGMLDTDLQGAAARHAEWSRYVTGGTSDPPEFDPPLFTEDEYAHMADVRRVFEVAKLFVPLSLVVIIVRLRRARERGSRPMWRLVRDGALVSAAVVAIIGAVAVVAFEPLFLAFHYVFFPQGNFLFDPATSNLLRLYPDWYWEGISLRVGLSFIAVALFVAGAAMLRLRTAK